MRILLVEDDEDDYVLVRDVVSEIDAWRGELDWCRDVAEGLRRLEEGVFEVCLVDYYLGARTGLDLLAHTRRSHGMPPVILLTGREDRHADVQAMLRGAADYLPKVQLDAPTLERSIRYAMQQAQIVTALRQRGAQLEAANARLRETHMHLVHAEKMASLGGLVAGIAHEINSPLSFVVNNLFVIDERLERHREDEAAKSGVDALHAEDLSQLVQDARGGATRMQELVAKLRCFARFDGGELVDIDVPETIDTVLLFLRHRTHGRIEMRTRFEADRQLRWYRGELNQVLMNVVANAVDAIEGKGRIEIATARGEEPRAYTIRVRDTGDGIPAEIRGRIFEPFFTTKPPGQGTGLGLAISQRVMEEHGGRIDLWSEEGMGTEVALHFPVGEPLAEGSGETEG